MATRSSSYTPTASASQTYFDLDTASCRVSPLKPRKKSSSFVTLDTLRQQSGTPFDLPPNATLYAKRALPALPPLSALPALSKCCSSDSLSSASLPSRSSTSITNRQSCDKSLPPVPSFHQCDSSDSIASRPASMSRPRANRGLSFRTMLHRQSSESSTEDVPSLTPSASSRTSRTDSLISSEDAALARISTSTIGSRRPSIGSLKDLRAGSKKLNSAAPPLPANRTSTGGKNSGSLRWNPFRNSAEECKEDIAPMPVTPPYIRELSFSQCYYFFARNCNGYVLSNGANGNACEGCANEGFFGSP